MLAFHTETGESCPERWVFAAENSNVWTWQDSVKVASALTLAQTSAKARGWRHTGEVRLSEGHTWSNVIVSSRNWEETVLRPTFFPVKMAEVNCVVR
jgi:hypothetical protein